MTGVGAAVSGLLLLLLTSLAVAILARFVRIPYTVGLVLAGLSIGLFGHHPAIAITPDLVMLVFLPALLFAGAWTISIDDLRRYWVTIAMLAVVGVAAGIFISYALLVYGAGIDPRVAVLFGAIVAATDPVAVLALFRELGIDRRLATIVEGESLFNDGTAVVAFRTLLLTTSATAGTFVLHPAGAIGQFAVMTLGGVGIGASIGLILSLVLKTTDDYLVEAAGTTIAAYGSYLLAEWLHVSGIMAVIAAGIVLSKVGFVLGAFTSARESVNRFWEYIAFLANSVLFVLVGLSVDLRALSAVGYSVAWGIAAVVVARAIVVYGISFIGGFAGIRLPPAWQHVLALGGLRGALSMALVLSLPEDFQNRAQIVAMVFSVVLFTLVIQGFSLRWAIGALGVASERNQSSAARTLM